MKVEYDPDKIKDYRTEDITIKYSDLNHAKFDLPPELKLTYAEPIEHSSCWVRRPNTDDPPSVGYIIDEAVNHYLTQVVYKDLNYLEIGYVLPTFNYISTPSDLINKAPKKVTKYLWGFMLEKTAEVHFESWSLTVHLSIQTNIKKYYKSTRRPKRYKAPVLTTRAKKKGGVMVTTIGDLNKEMKNYRNKMIEQDVLQEAINTYGTDHQCLVAMEECAELIQALSKPLRKDFNGRTSKRYEHIAEEIADVELSIACVKQALNLQGSVAQIKEQKLSRLWANIKEYKKEHR